MKTLDQRLAWLAGIIDGEGSIALHLERGRRRMGHGLRERGSYKCLRFRFILSNTSEVMIKEVVDICDALGIGYYTRCYKPKAKNCKLAWWFEIKGKRNIERLLVETVPFLISKQPQAQLVLKAIERRESLTASTSMKESAFRVHKDEVIVDCIEKVKLLNQRGTGVNTALDQFAPQSTRRESAASNVVGPEGDENKPTRKGTVLAEKEE